MGSELVLERPLFFGFTNGIHLKFHGRVFFRTAMEAQKDVDELPEFGASPFLVVRIYNLWIDPQVVGSDSQFDPNW